MINIELELERLRRDFEGDMSEPDNSPLLVYLSQIRRLLILQLRAQASCNPSSNLGDPH